MIALENFFRFVEAVIFRRFVVPRKLRDEFEKIPRADVFGGVRIHEIEFFEFVVDGFFYLALEMEFLRFLFKLLIIGRVAFGVRAELFLNRLQLFAEKIFALIFFDAFVEFVLDFFLNA